MAYATTNPYTGETLKTFPDATDQEIQTALNDAYEAFKSWRNVSFADRAKVMTAAATILRRDIDKYAKLLTLEMGKLYEEAKLETILSAEIFEYYATNAENLLKPEKLPVADPKEGKPFWCISLRGSSSPLSHGTSPTTRSHASSRRSFPPGTRCC